MKVQNKDYRTVWMEGPSVFMIEQNLLPFQFQIFESVDYQQTCHAIKTMIVRGAGAIGAAAGFAMAQAFLQAPAVKYVAFVDQAKSEIEATRPTARNLFYAVERVYQAGLISVKNAIEEAQNVADEDAVASRAIGDFGNGLIKPGFRIETHCNAGWLAFVDWGTALSPVYKAHETGKNIFVWVDETRPRAQGARLTAWELQNAGVPHKILPDSAGAWLMSQQKVDMMIVGADRIAANGDTANKIGTFEKAIVAQTFDVPFYVAAPTSTFDLECKSGNEIIIEERSGEEVLYQTGPDENNELKRIRVASPGSFAINPAFDVTPAEYITGIITEKGIVKPGGDNDLMLQ
ncbi:MAG: S-methyl-5-thioribose-1-phosphate isomerase [Bacteroidetes bacterium 4484_276]|nr:MAG: S-methyl-5-thioribose-1-phosphate isomerase [Bacteroidetes bacterium 4484_276]